VPSVFALVHDWLRRNPSVFALIGGWLRRSPAA
jgi:hypothetical protein